MKQFRQLTILIVVGILFVGVSTAVLLAQTGGGFDLSWSTVDGGGGTSNGGGYSLYGVIGQPDVGEHNGGTYTLEGGFLHCAMLAMPDVAISHTNPDLNLTWNDVGATYYTIYRDTAPYFTPTNAHATTNTPMYTDTGAGNGSANYYYFINGDDGFGCGSGLSNHVGAFNYDLIPGT